MLDVPVSTARLYLSRKATHTSRARELSPLAHRLPGGSRTRNHAALRAAAYFASLRRVALRRAGDAPAPLHTHDRRASNARPLTPQYRILWVHRSLDAPLGCGGPSPFQHPPPLAASPVYSGLLGGHSAGS